MKLSEYIGDFLDLSAAYSKSELIRSNSTSGGVVTSSLLYAMKKHIIDGAIVVSMNRRKRWKPEVIVATTQNRIIEAAGSKYCQIPINEFIKKIPFKGKYAVVGLPCLIRAIRRMQEKGKLKNVILLIGLFCGYNMPLEATEFILTKIGINKNEIKSMRYRAGKYPGGFLVETKKGKKKFIPKYYYDFLNLMFLSKGCQRCRDYTNELTDISCGDAWGFDKYSVVITRTKVGKKIINNEHLHIQKIDENQLFRMHWHNIKHKKVGSSCLINSSSWFLRIFKYILPFALLGFIAKLRRLVIKK